MQVLTQTLTFTAGTAVQLAIVDANGNALTHGSGIYVEPAVTNSHVCYVGDNALATGTSTTNHVIKELQIPPSFAADKGSIDHWEVQDQNGNDRVEFGQFAFDGTTGEKVRVTVYIS